MYRHWHSCLSYLTGPLYALRWTPAIKGIKDKAFFDYSGLMAAIFNNELEEIGAWAFCGCRSLIHIEIPPPLHQVDQGMGILWLLMIGGCNSQWWAGGDWGVGISKMQVSVQAHQDPIRHQGGSWDDIQWVLDYDDCEVLQQDWRVSIQGDDAVGGIVGSTRIA